MDSSLIAIAVILSVVELAAGIALGYWIRGNAQPAPLAEAEPKADNAELEKARDALSKLHELATSVAADVGEHNSRVQAMNQELTQQSTGGALDSAVLGTVAQIIQANERLQVQLRDAESKLQEQAQQIEAHAADAMTDALTNIPNRRYFDGELKQRLAEWNRKGTPVCLLMVDVDHFKKFNDTHGHLAGDEVLRRVAQVLRKTVRDMDIVARYGGEEFAIIMPASTLRDGEAGAQRLVPQVESTQLDFEGKTLRVSISGGLAQANSGEDPGSLIKRADDALYAAKKAGRNRAFAHDGQQVRAIAALAGQRAKGAEPKAAEPRAMTPRTEIPAGDNNRSDLQTGLPNRLALCEEIRRRVAESHRYESNLSLVIVNVDGFEQLAEDHGSAATDLIVKTMSQFLTAGMREMDLVARYSDRIFAVLLPGTPLSQAVGVAERLRTAVARCPLKSKDFELRMTVSAGIAEVSGADDYQALLDRAIKAMNSAIEGGCDATHVHNGRQILVASPAEATA